MTIAVDFDGTIVEHRYPEIGAELPFAIETLKMLRKDGHKIVLWSVREGQLLDDAVNWCRERGVEFYAVNRDYPVFIDDRNLGGLPDWGTIYRMIRHHRKWHHIIDDAVHDALGHYEPPKKKHWWKF